MLCAFELGLPTSADRLKGSASTHTARKWRNPCEGQRSSPCSMIARALRSRTPSKRRCGRGGSVRRSRDASLPTRTSLSSTRSMAGRRATRRRRSTGCRRPFPCSLATAARPSKPLEAAHPYFVDRSYLRPRDIVGLYRLARRRSMPPAQTVDEKSPRSGIWIAPAPAAAAPRSQMPERRTHDYKRNGTTSLSSPPSRVATGPVA